MLVLSRRPQENIYITVGNTEVKLCVIGIDKNKVRLGFDAPSEVAIHREEVYKKLMGGLAKAA